MESNEIFSFNLDWRLGSNLQSTDCIKSSVLLTRPGEVSNFTVDLETDEEGMVWKKISPCCIHYIRSKVLGVVLSWQVNLTPPPQSTPPRNKGLIRPYYYYGKPMVNKPALNKALFLGGYTLRWG